MNAPEEKNAGISPLFTAVCCSGYFGDKNKVLGEGRASAWLPKVKLVNQVKYFLTLEEQISRLLTLKNMNHRIYALKRTLDYLLFVVSSALIIITKKSNEKWNWHWTKTKRSFSGHQWFWIQSTVSWKKKQKNFEGPAQPAQPAPPGRRSDIK